MDATLPGPAAALGHMLGSRLHPFPAGISDGFDGRYLSCGSPQAEIHRAAREHSGKHSLPAYLTRMMHSSSSSRQPRRFACDRCRHYKLRCERTAVSSRDCARCQKVGIPCTTSNKDGHRMLRGASFNPPDGVGMPPVASLRMPPSSAARGPFGDSLQTPLSINMSAASLSIHNEMERVLMMPSSCLSRTAELTSRVVVSTPTHDQCRPVRCQHGYQHCRG
jgi:hypothetical protein